jgi:hypothetical protein
MKDADPLLPFKSRDHAAKLFPDGPDWENAGIVAPSTKGMHSEKVQSALDGNTIM